MQLPNARCTLLLLSVAIATGACEGLLDVDDPSSVNDSDIRNDLAASLWEVGALFAVQDGWSDGLARYSVVADEAYSPAFLIPMYLRLDQGYLDDRNEGLINGFYPYLARGRWMADEAIFVLDSLDTAGELTDRTSLAKSYFYGAISYSTIADWMDDFTFSDRTVDGPAIGPENMGALYDTAITYLTRALEIEDSDDFRRDALALRARVRHGAAVWNMLGQTPINMGAHNGLVSDPLAVLDANAALDANASDWRYEFDFHSPSWGAGVAWEFNSIRELLRFGERYVVGDRGAASIVLLDPIDGVPDSWLESFTLGEFFAPGASGYVNLTVFSAREMHLIIAEDALARADTAAFASEINVIRGFDGLTDWTTASTVTARDMLIYQRQVNLFFQGRRLHDMYRFGIKSDTWETHSAAYTTPGTFFPIPQAEINRNCHLNPAVECP